MSTDEASESLRMGAGRFAALEGGKLERVNQRREFRRVLVQLRGNCREWQERTQKQGEKLHSHLMPKRCRNSSGTTGVSLRG